jgi:hypothetical protein
MRCAWGDANGRRGAAKEQRGAFHLDPPAAGKIATHRASIGGVIAAVVGVRPCIRVCTRNASVASL